MNEIGLLGMQVRMARAAKNWSLADLAKIAGIGLSTLRKIEEVDGPADISGGLASTLNYRRAERIATIAKIKATFELHGIELLGDFGRGPGLAVKIESNGGLSSAAASAEQMAQSPP